MLSNLKRREGFTLIELMIVVAIIGILAAIAIPNFIKFQLRSKAGEAKVNLAGIRTSQESYFAEAGTYMDFPPTPVLGYVPQQKTPFNPAGCPNPLPVFVSPMQGYCWIGWQPEGDVYYAYTLEAGFNNVVVAVAPSGGVVANQFYATAVADIDGDLAQNTWGINQPDIQGNVIGAAAAGGQLALPAICGASAVGGGGAAGPVDSGTGLGVLGQVGPCDSNDMGRNVF
jgi:type IV pilus assembly protein PilA